MIFEFGIGTDHYFWTGVLAKVSKHTMARGYDSDGHGRCDPAKTLPRTTEDMISDLNALMTNVPIPSPYIMVRRSMGADNIRLYTS